MSTFKRQAVFDLIFLLENVLLLTFGCLADISPLNDIHTMQYFILSIIGFHFLGLSLKLVYYKFYHLWKDILRQEHSKNQTDVENVYWHERKPKLPTPTGPFAVLGFKSGEILLTGISYITD